MTSDGEVLLHGYAVKCDVAPSKIKRNLVELLIQLCTPAMHVTSLLGFDCSCVER